jgi:pterin-4a-carbinolamine dehydratase
MTEQISPRQFHEAGGVDDWRVVSGAACAKFNTGSFNAGVALVNAIGDLADAANHHPDVDLRYPSVTVRLVTHEVGGLSSRDIELARQISAAAHDLGVAADLSYELEVRAGGVGPDVACPQAGMVGIDVVGDDPPRVDANDVRRQVGAGRGRTGDGFGGAADLQEVGPFHACLGHLVDDEGDAGLAWMLRYLALRLMLNPAMSIVPRAAL